MKRKIDILINEENNKKVLTNHGGILLYLYIVMLYHVSLCFVEVVIRSQRGEYRNV